MLKIEFLKLNLGGVVVRYYLMMMIVIAAGFTGQMWVALLALPIFLSAILAMTFKIETAKNVKLTARKTIQMKAAA